MLHGDGLNVSCRAGHRPSPGDRGSDREYVNTGYEIARAQGCSTHIIRRITDDDVRDAVDAFMFAPTTSHVVIGDGYVRDPAATVEADSYATRVLGTVHATWAARLNAVRTAILPTRPEKRRELDQLPWAARCCDLC